MSLEAWRFFPLVFPGPRRRAWIEKGKRNGYRSCFNDRTVERFDQILHTGVHVEILCQESSDVPDRVFEMLLGEHQGGDELLQMALKSLPTELDHGLLIVIKNKTVLRSIDSKLMKRRTHL